jgi:hypothetical protein
MCTRMAMTTHKPASMTSGARYHGLPPAPPRPAPITMPRPTPNHVGGKSNRSILAGTLSVASLPVLSSAGIGTLPFIARFGPHSTVFAPA